MYMALVILHNIISSLQSCAQLKDISICSGRIHSALLMLSDVTREEGNIEGEC
jgi:hypothetical protein